MEVVELARLILALSPRDFARLVELIKADGGEDLGVREPRRPGPESPGDTVALDVQGIELDAEVGKVGEEAWPTPHNLPADYWETAE